MVIECEVFHSQTLGEIVNEVLKDLRRKNLSVPDSYMTLCTTEPFKTRMDNEKPLYGYKRTPFGEDSKFCDGLYINLKETEKYDPWVIYISIGVLSNEGIEEVRKKAEEKKIEYGTLRDYFHESIIFYDKITKSTTAKVEYVAARADSEIGKEIANICRK